MSRTNTKRGFTRLGLTAMGVGLLALLGPAGASAGVVVYPSTDVPKAFDDGQTITSTITVPPGRTAATDIDVAPLQAFTPIGSADRGIVLRAPSGNTSTLVPPGCNTFSVNVNFDDQTTEDAFDTNTDCSPPDGKTFKSTAAALNSHAGPAAGPWAMTASDPGNLLMAGPGALQGWSLRVTHATVQLDASAKPQKLKKGKVKFDAGCDANCTIVTGKHAKSRTLNLGAGVSDRFKVPLKASARKRLADGGKAKIRLTTTDETNGEVTSILKVRIKG